MFDISDPAGALVRGFALTAAAVLWVVLITRIVGLRSVSKMTAFDFVTTIAIGSLIATAGTASSWSAFLQAMAALAAVFAIQWILAKLLKATDRVEDAILNEPVLLMKEGRFIDTAMTENRVPCASIYEKLRKANVGDISNVHAVVLETTGDISVMHGDKWNPQLLDGVREPQPVAPAQGGGEGDARTRS